jgi:hypothetical protein
MVEIKQPDIIEVILKIVKVFEKLDIAYHIGGSLASSAFGIARATLDVDMVANIKFEQASSFEESLQEEFYVDVGMIQDAIKRGSSFNLIHLETMFKVDIFVLRNRAFDKQAFLRRVKKPVSEDGSLQFYFSTPEDIILNKLEWYKTGGEVSERQWNDILGVMKVQGEQLDMSYLKQWAEKLSILNLLEKAFNDAGI